VLVFHGGDKNRCPEAAAIKDKGLSFGYGLVSLRIGTFKSVFYLEKY
jgi:hypothetical protein